MLRAMRKLILLPVLIFPLLAMQSGGDPAGGKFTLEDATKGLSGKGPLWASLETNQGTIRCQLYDKQSPKTVANFVGLARGKRPWKDPKSGEWVTKPFYDGLKFHRVIPEFMIQGGDPLGNGTGDPGYKFEDETSNGLKFDKPGLLAMANAGPNTNGSQFFITERDAITHLNGRHTIFGECEPLDLVKKIARVPRNETDRSKPQDDPLQPVVMKKVTITRGKPKGK
jgi:peptidyl-prolyl cis-trans isomerase A (cyclophilin A)